MFMGNIGKKATFIQKPTASRIKIHWLVRNPGNHSDVPWKLEDLLQAEGNDLRCKLPCDMQSPRCICVSTLPRCKEGWQRKQERSAFIIYVWTIVSFHVQQHWGWWSRDTAGWTSAALSSKCRRATTKTTHVTVPILEFLKAQLGYMSSNGKSSFLTRRFSTQLALQN